MTALVGQCACGDMAFELVQEPLFVHACHCLDCKRKTGSSFGITCIVLEDDIDLKGAAMETIQSSPRTTLHRTQCCRSVIYGTSSAFEATAWLQTRFLEDLRQLHIGAHIWIKRKDPWLQLPDHLPQFDEGYEDRQGVWPQAQIDRLAEHIKGGSHR